MTEPPTTGPTGTNGGTKVGIGPMPITFCTIVVDLKVVKTELNALL